MVSETLEGKLATEYEGIRRREYELITHLLDVVPKIDGLSEERIGQMRDALFHADHPYLMVFVGPFSAGKSSLINALLGHDVLAVGPVPTTDRITMLRWGEEQERVRSGDLDTVFYPSPLLKKVSFVDTPGLESVFQKHEEMTRSFLHRADAVLLIMLATQAMTARNLDYLRTLQNFDKKVILVLNQADLLTPEEAETVRQYVAEQAQIQLGTKPEIWLMSARKGLEARAAGQSADGADPELDAQAWRDSGLQQIERYVDHQLSDVARLRQKLQTPLQISQSVTQSALEVVRGSQSTLDQYQSIAENIDQQLAAARREQDRSVREVNNAVSEKFGEAAMRGSEAIRELLRLNRAFGSSFRGLLELFGISRLVQSGSYTRAAFDERKAFEPIDQLPSIAAQLGPRLEGRDVQDIDDLVKYARREIDALPTGLREKVIGTVQAPIQYDRRPLQNIRPELEAIEQEAKTVEVQKLERTLRNTLLYLAAWELIIIILGIFVLSLNPATPEMPLLPVLIILVLLGLGGLGFLILPLRGRALEADYTRRMLALQARYIETIDKAADQQIEYGMKLRRDAVSPLARLIEAQTQIHSEQLKTLQAAQQELVKIESDLASLGKRLISLPGLRG